MLPDFYLVTGCFVPMNIAETVVTGFVRCRFATDGAFAGVAVTGCMTVIGAAANESKEKTYNNNQNDYSFEFHK